MTKLLSKFWPYLLIGLLLFLLGSWLYISIKDSGRAEVQLLWDKQKQRDTVEIQKIKDEYTIKEKTHQKENSRIAYELLRTKQAHTVAIENQRNIYAERLLVAETRGKIYQRLSEGGTSQCRYLASHATELDRTLEEGRYLVQELRGTLGLREDQLRQLGNQIRNDRLLFND